MLEKEAALMAWIFDSDEGCFIPDGKPFAPPVDSFERHYNKRLEEAPACVSNDALEPFNGYPLSTRMYRNRPANPKWLPNMLDYFFAPHFLETCRKAGNTDVELDLLARRLLTQALEAEVRLETHEMLWAERLGLISVSSTEGDEPIQ